MIQGRTLTFKEPASPDISDIFIIKVQNYKKMLKIPNPNPY